MNDVAILLAFLAIAALWMAAFAAMQHRWRSVDGWLGVAAITVLILSLAR